MMLLRLLLPLMLMLMRLLHDSRWASNTHRKRWLWQCLTDSAVP